MLPTEMDVRMKAEFESSIDPVEEFIWNNEPVTNHYPDINKWREDLHKMLVFLKADLSRYDKAYQKYYDMADECRQKGDWRE
jgi:hypothetical protein